jgi:hypothetical protein
MTHYDTAVKTVAAFNIAAELGEQHGRSAAEWWWQDNVTNQPASAANPVARIKELLDEGDPLLFDSLPAPDLSGQWADGWTPDSLFRYCFDRGRDPNPYHYQEEEQLQQELCDHYEQAFNSAVQDYVDGAAARELEPTE